MKTSIIIFTWLIPAIAWAELSDPIRLINDDVPHAAPIIADIDGDGIRDLLVGQFRKDPYTAARAQVFRNVGTNAAPIYSEPAWLQAGGQDASVDEMCYTGFGPQLVDFNGDGLLDLVSGARAAQLYVFHGQDDGSFAAATTVVYASKEYAREFQYNSRIFLHDWDQDGDLDLLATRRNTVWLIRNEGTNENLQFGIPSELLRRQTDQESFSCSAVADWDGDSNVDLVVGLWDGSVIWYRNEPSDDAIPKLGPAKLLVRPGAAYSVRIDQAGNYVRPNRPAGHIRISLVDYNDDGLLDLLVGDAWSTTVDNKARPKPTAEQIARRVRAYQRDGDLQRILSALQQQPENESDQARRARLAKIDATRNECSTNWQVGHPSATGTRHGSVWLFHRTAR